MFIVQTAADIFAHKTNFELAFAARPSLVELTRTVEASFSAEIALKLPSGVPQHSFHVAKIKVYDEDRNKWVDLISEAQLSDYCQCYAFQPENPWHKESPKEIPPAVRPPVAGSGAVPLQHQYAAAGGAPPPGSATSQPRSNSGYGYNPTAAAAAQPQPRPSAGGIVKPGVGGATNAAVVPYAAGSYSQAAATAAGRPSVDASFDEKVRVVFNEFDMKGLRMLEVEDLKQGFRALGFDFTTATMNDLFQKGDANSDGRISYSEFERFARLYPIMTDCLFYRSRAFWDEDNMVREVEAEKEAARQAAELAERVGRDHDNAHKAADDAQKQVQAAETDIRDMNGRLRDLTKEAEHAQREKERAAKDRHDRETEMGQARDRERFARQQHGDAAREAEKQDRRIAAAAQEAAKADEKVRQLQQALAEAQRAAERAQAGVRQTQTEAEGAKGRERDAAKHLDAAVRDLPRVEEGLKQADGALQQANNTIRDLDTIARDIARDADDAARRRDAHERNAQIARDNEAQLAAEVERARSAADDKDRSAKARQADLEEAQRQRQQVTPHERALVEQELRLREQRDTLEEKESKLKNEAGSFLAGLRSSLQSQGRAYSRDPSNARGAVTDYRRGQSNNF